MCSANSRVQIKFITLTSCSLYKLLPFNLSLRHISDSLLILFFFPTVYR